MRDQLSSSDKELFYKSLIEVYVDKTQNPRFIERHWLKEQVEEQLADPNCRFLLLTAEPGAGKSAFIAWLAHLYPNWGRYFIRRDQRTPLGDVGAHSLLLQIGFQLAAIYPDLFNQEQIEITVRQRIGQASNSEIVGAEIQRIVASPFRRKIIDIQQEVRENRKTEVTGIQIGEIYSDVRLVPVDDLQYMALLDPAIALARTNPAQQIVVLVDALDELSYRDINGTLIHWLATCPELPPNVRFILTARPNTPELEHFCETKRDQIQKLSIQEKDPRVIADSLNYVKQWVDSTPRIQTALQTKGHEIEPFVKQAAEKADGNLGYLEAIARAVDQADDEQIAQFLDLSSLPQELEDLYGFFLRKIKSTVGQNTIRVEGGQPNQVHHYEAWLEVYRPILGVLAVAREPVTLQQIQQLGHIPCDWTYLVNAIEKLRQFLDQVDNGRYRLYHSTLPEFLTSEKAKAAYDYCYIDPVGQNQRVIRHYKGIAESWQEVNLEQIDNYGFRHLTQHLVQANLQQELHELLDLDKGSLNAWFEVKDSNGGVAEFLADVALAWNQAEKEFESSHQAELLGLQYRYALLTASVNNLSTNIPVALLIALVKTEEWKPERALAYAQQILERYQKSEALRELAPYLPEPLRSQAYQTALACWSISSRLDSSGKVMILTDMVQYDPGTLLKVLPDVQLIDDPKIPIWRKLGECLPSNLTEEAIHFLDTSKADKEQWTEILIALAPSLPAKMLDALDALSEISDPSQQADALAYLIPHLPNTLISKATHYQHLNGDPKILSAWLIRLPELIPVLRHRSVNISDLLNISNLSDQALEVLSKLAERFKQIKYPQLCQILNTIIPYVPETAFSEIVEATKILNGEEKAQILYNLIPRLSNDVLLEAGKFFFDVCDGFQLERLLPFLPESLLIDAFKIVWRFESPWRKNILTLLLRRLPKSQLLDATQIAGDFPDKRISQEALSTLAEYLSDDLLPIAYQATKGIRYEASEIPLSHHTSEQIIQNALREVQNITDDKEQTRALRELIPFLPSAFVVQILEVGTEIQDKQSLKAAGSAFIQGQLEEAGERFMEALARRIHSEGGKWIADLAEIASRFPKNEDLWEKILSLVEKNPYSQMWVLARLTPYVPDTLRPKLIELAKMAVAKFRGSHANFWFLIYRLPEITPDVIKILESNLTNGQHAYYMAEVIPFLPAPFLLNIFRSAQVSADEYGLHRAEKIFGFHIYRAIVPEKFDSVWQAQDVLAQETAIEKFIGSGHWFYQTGLSSLDIFKEVITNKDETFINISLVELLQVSQAIQDEFEQVNALKALVPYLLEAMPYAFAKALAIPNAQKRKEVLESLVPQIPDGLMFATLDLVEATQNDEHQALALTSLSDRLSVETISKALKIAQMIQDGKHQLNALNSLSYYLPPEFLPEAFKAILKIQGDSQLLAILSGLLLYSETLRWTVQGKKGYQFDTILQISPDLLEVLLENLPRTPEFILKLREVLRKNPEVLQELPPDLRQFMQDLSLTNVLMVLALLLLMPLIIVLLGGLTNNSSDGNPEDITDKIIKELTSQYKKSLPFLQFLINFAPEPLVRQVLRSEDEGIGGVLKLMAYLSILPDYLKPDLYEVYRRELQAISPNSWGADKKLVDLVPLLPDSLLPEALEVAKAFRGDGDFDRVRVLTSIFSRLSTDLLPEAIDAVKTTEREKSRLDALRELIQLVPEIPEIQLSALLDIARTFQVPLDNLRSKNWEEIKESENCLSGALIALVPHLTIPLLREALEIAHEIQIEDARHYALKAIAPHLPLSEALTVIQIIDSRAAHSTTILGDQIKILNNLVKRFAGKSPNDSYTLWQASLHLLAERSHERKVLLTALEWLAPLIKDLGMQEGFAATLQGIQRVVEWYP